ncbi:MAG: sulfotransferase domain-containing protein, partial [Pseudorhodobacter sp.]|nr:sulfotransferase domain-containing protein [Pseudorhodobacter sp.]
MEPRFDSFVLFAEMRTGSNFLEANLNAMPGVSCHGELFNPHFIGKLNQDAAFGVTLAEREADPLTLLRQMREENPGIAGFRYFHDHDPRVLPAVLADPRCAKVILTRNPVESYVSWKIAQATGQWKLTQVKRLKTAKAQFDAAEFSAHLAQLQAFQLALLHGLQASGQTAFYIDYEDINDTAVLNGLALFLGVEPALSAPDGTLKKQNPEDISEKVENFAEMEAALAQLDRFNLSRTPNFEPRRAPAIPTFIAAGR